MSTPLKRRYSSETRAQSADATRKRVLDSARRLFSTDGIDQATVAAIAGDAGVASSTVYALFKSKEGMLRAIVEEAMFGPAFDEAYAKLAGVTDAVQRIALTAHVARTIYERESAEVELIRGASAYSPSLKTLEQELEQRRFGMQKERIELLFEQSQQREGLGLEDARSILWMYTSREIYRMLVVEKGWTPERYQLWLEATLLQALTAT